MNCTLANQECSSGCESGWTLYLQHSNSISNSFNQENDQAIDDDKKVEVIGKRSNEEEEEEEDLSMVSDASSGPPAVHLHEEEGCGGSNGGTNNGWFYHFPDTNDDDVRLCKNSKNGEKRRRGGVHQDLLDDTASSSFSDFSDKSCTLSRCQSSMENVLEYSQGYSSTQFEVRLPYQEQYDLVQYTQPGNQLHQNQWSEGVMP